MKRKALLYRLIYGKPVSLRPYERICVDRFIDALPPQNASKLRSQLELLRFRYRQTEDRVLLLLPELDDQVPSGVLFADRSDELLVARMVVAQNGKRLDAKLFFHKGRLSSLQFNRSPVTAEFTDSEPVGIKSFTLVNDPDTPGPTPNREVFPSSCSGCVKSLAKICKVVPLGPPLEEGERQRVIKAYDLHFPAEYLDTVSQADGFVVGRVTVYGLRALRNIPQRNGELTVLAESQTGAVLGIDQNNQMVSADSEGEPLESEPTLSSFVVAENRPRAE